MRDGILTAVQTDPQIIFTIREIADRALRGKADADQAVEDIMILAPELAPAIKEQLNTKDVIAILSLLATLIGCVIAGLQLFKADSTPNIVINNTITSNPAPVNKVDSLVNKSLSKEQVRKQKQIQKKKMKKRKKRDKKRKARTPASPTGLR